MKRTQIFIAVSLLITVSLFHTILSKKYLLRVEGSKNLASLLCMVFTQKRSFEGIALEERIECLNHRIDRATKKTLSDNEQDIVKEVKSFVGYLKDVRKWEKRGKASSRMERVEKEKLLAIELICEQNEIIFLRQGKKAQCLSKN